jgi:hypothetical protein
MRQTCDAGAAFTLPQCSRFVLYQRHAVKAEIPVTPPGAVPLGRCRPEILVRKCSAMPGIKGYYDAALGPESEQDVNEEETVLPFHAFTEYLLSTGEHRRPGPIDSVIA